MGYVSDLVSISPFRREIDPTGWTVGGAREVSFSHDGQSPIERRHAAKAALLVTSTARPGRWGSLRQSPTAFSRSLGFEDLVPVASLCERAPSGTPALSVPCLAGREARFGRRSSLWREAIVSGGLPRPSGATSLDSRVFPPNWVHGPGRRDRPGADLGPGQVFGGTGGKQIKPVGYFAGCILDASLTARVGTPFAVAFCTCRSNVSPASSQLAI